MAGGSEGDRGEGKKKLAEKKIARATYVRKMSINEPTLYRDSEQWLLSPPISSTLLYNDRDARVSLVAKFN